MRPVKRDFGALLPPPSAVARLFCSGEPSANVMGKYDVCGCRFGIGDARHSEVMSTSELRGGDVAPDAKRTVASIIQSLAWLHSISAPCR